MVNDLEKGHPFWRTVFLAAFLRAHSPSPPAPLSGRIIYDRFIRVIRFRHRPLIGAHLRASRPLMLRFQAVTDELFPDRVRQFFLANAVNDNDASTDAFNITADSGHG